MKKSISKIFYLSILLLHGACTPQVEDPRQVQNLPDTYPDYTDITIPCNIAPLNFLMNSEDIDAVAARLCCGTDSLWIEKNGRKITFPLAEWKDWCEQHTGKTTQVTLFSRADGQWTQYKDFTWNIVPDKMDRYVTYRLIEPGYEVWNAIQLEERNTEDFTTKTLADNSLLGNRCMNCHIHGGDKGQYSLFYVRGEGGATFLNRGHGLEKAILKNEKMNGSTVYGDFSRDARYGVFSTNVIMPAFHSIQARRLEVYDTTSDLCIVDFEHQRMILSPLTADSTRLETFPTFAPDGRTIYYCSAARTDSLPGKVGRLHYSLCKIAFDPKYGEWGHQVDTLWNARTEGGSANFPKVSPDGKFLVFTRTDYGTFPIWHKEADLYLINLHTGTVKPLKAANSQRSDTYHTWSHNSRWLAFASKRGDGQYGRVYFAYIDAKGNARKAFVLPQEDPEKDQLNLKSYNIPDLSQVSMPYDAPKTAALDQQKSATPFR